MRAKIEQGAKKIKISTKKGIVNINIDYIICGKQFSVGTLIYMEDGSHFLMKERISELLEIIREDNFVMINPHSLINIRYIDAIVLDQVIMKNGIKYWMNKKYKKHFMSRLSSYFEIEYETARQIS